MSRVGTAGSPARPRRRDLHDGRAVRAVYAAHPSGVTAVAALDGGRPVGIAASSFVPVSLDPPLVSVCVAHTSSTWPVLAAQPLLGISVLSAGQEALSRRLGGPADARFTGTAWYATPGGAVLLDGAAAWFECRIEQQIRAGDHDIVVLAVQDLDLVHHSPLVFHASQYRQLA